MNIQLVDVYVCPSVGKEIEWNGILINFSSTFLHALFSTENIKISMLYYILM